MYHSGRKKKEYASPCAKFLDALEKAARKMPPHYAFDPGHADGIRHVNVDAGERALHEIIYECQRNLEASGHARPNVARGQRRVVKARSPEIFSL